MFQRSIDEFSVEKQDAKDAQDIYTMQINGAVFLGDGRIHCPLCVYVHENNTFCQQ